ncbi:hypothetical protein BS637_11640 [Clostridium tepidum]|uniref:Uncharacterized protein n=1 Tax=Clostridium tepidum TaxID=1962263 RepID=A0ABX3L1M1_9CLOT|nr:hypothetical protein BS637_11640 [Clostridium tepidum]
MLLFIINRIYPAIVTIILYFIATKNKRFIKDLSNKSMKKLGVILCGVGLLIDFASTLFENNIKAFIHRTAYNIFFGFLFIYLCVAH